MGNDYDNYFVRRSVDPLDDSKEYIPRFLGQVLPGVQARILDIGCGTGSILHALVNGGYQHAAGVDIAEEAVAICRKKGLDVSLINAIEELQFVDDSRKYDFAIMSHVLEHIPKEKIIPTLRHIRNELLKQGGALVVMVPNAQSSTGAYWAYEDFTHHTLFTSGSLRFALMSAGFDSIQYLDPKGLLETGALFRPFKAGLLHLYDLNQLFWNKVTSSSFHAPSERIYSFELKVLAS